MNYSLKSAEIANSVEKILKRELTDSEAIFIIDMVDSFCETDIDYLVECINN